MHENTSLPPGVTVTDLFNLLIIVGGTLAAIDFILILLLWDKLAQKIRTLEAALKAQSKSTN